MNTTTQKLAKFLNDEIEAESSLSADDIPINVDLEVGEEISWAASTWIEPHLLNIFLCTTPTEPAQALLTRHGDRGVIVGLEGPWNSISDAKNGAGSAPEGWTDI